MDKCEALKHFEHILECLNLKDKCKIEFYRDTEPGAWARVVPEITYRIEVNEVVFSDPERGRAWHEQLYPSPDLNHLIPKKDIPLLSFFHELVHIMKKHPLQLVSQGVLTEEEREELELDHEKEVRPLALNFYLTYRAGGKIRNEASKSS